KMQANTMSFDFGSAADVKCEIEVPKNIESSIEGNNGKINVEELRGNLNLQLKNGKVALNPARDVKYHYDLHVKNGKVSELDSSDSPDAIQIKLNLVNGVVSNDKNAED